MSRCLILTSRIDGIEHLTIDPSDFSCILAADGGLDRARELGLSPTHLIGDYDSTDRPDAATVEQAENTIFLPTVKDMTDSEAALDWAVGMGYTDILVLGGLGGRFDHTMGNVGLLSKHLSVTRKIVLQDGANRVRMFPPGTYPVRKDDYRYLGLLAYGGTVHGLSVSGTKYPLRKYDLSDSTTLGVSNEILDKEATVSFAEGRLLVIQSNDT